METKTLYIYAHWDEYNKVFGHSLSAWIRQDDVLVEERQIEFETLPERELRIAAHAKLMEKKQKVLADAQVEANEIDAVAQELLSLEDHSNGR